MFFIQQNEKKLAIKQAKVQVVIEAQVFEEKAYATYGPRWCLKYLKNQLEAKVCCSGSPQM
jgi:hypothetical protein